MPTLPTLTINDAAIWNRVLAAFPGATDVEKAAAYKKWLKELVETEVRNHEQRQAALNVDTSVKGFLNTTAT